MAAGALIYFLLLVGCVALIRPFVNAGISDDFSFIRSAKDFADTGRMVYNGWSSPILGWLVPFGALFIKLFGFSFTSARTACFVIALVNGLLLQWILLRAGCTRALALFGATAVLLSPICLPQAVLFFTDGPGLLAFLVTLALCIRILRAETPRATCLWIALAFLASVSLGTVRQLLWMCTLVMVPSAVWLVRKRKGVLPWAMLCFVLSAAAIALVLHWWSRQPYALTEPLILHYPLNAWARYTVLPGIELLVVIAPVLSLFLLQRVAMKVYATSALVALLVALLIGRNPYRLLAMSSDSIFGSTPQWFSLAALAYAAALTPIAISVIYAAFARQQYTDTRGEVGLRELAVLLAPFSLVLFLVVSTREAFFARYLLVIMASLAIWLTKLWSGLGESRRRGLVAPVLAASALVALYCGLSVIQLHDTFRSTAATLSLTQWYKAQGLPRSELEATFSFDGWYQIEQTGHINEPRIKVPPGAFVDHRLPPQIAVCHNFFLPQTPSIHPVYGIGSTIAPCFVPPEMHSVEYTSWMAPHRHTLFIARFAPKYALPAQ